MPSRLDLALRKIRPWWNASRRIIALVLISVSGFTALRTYGPEYFCWTPWNCNSDTTPETEVLSGSTVVGSTLDVWLEGELPPDYITVTASSEAVGHPVDLLVDGDPSTAWACGPCADTETPGVSEFIRFVFEGPVDLTEIVVHNGFPAESGFDENNRAFVIITSMAAQTFSLTLADTSAKQTITTAGAEQTFSVEFRIDSVHRGTLQEQSFGLSEVTFFGRYRPAE